jgi:hypothetical protein
MRTPPVVATLAEHPHQREVLVNKLYALTLSLVLAALVGTAVAADRNNIVIPQDNTSFAVDRTSIVRIWGKGEPRSTIEATVVSGPAKIKCVNDVFYRKNGKPVTDKMVKEFDFNQTGTGTVKVRLTVTPPGKDTKADVKEFTWDVKDTSR